MYCRLPLILLTIALASARASDVKEKRQVSCGNLDFRDPSGVITTPNYPYGYGNNMVCVYTIQPNVSAFSVKFTFCDCLLESAYLCRYDSIELGNLGKKCGGHLEGERYTVYSTNKKVEVTFISDISVTYRGCKIAYSITDSLPVCSSGSGNGTTDYTTPNYTYPNYTTPNYTYPNYTTPNYTYPNYTTPNYTYPNYTTPNYTYPNYTTPNYTTPNYTYPNYTTPNYTTPNYTTPNYTTPNYTYPNYTTPNYTTPNYTTPNYTIPSSNFTTGSNTSNFTTPSNFTI